MQAYSSHWLNFKVCVCFLTFQVIYVTTDTKEFYWCQVKTELFIWHVACVNLNSKAQSWRIYGKKCWSQKCPCIASSLGVYRTYYLLIMSIRNWTWYDFFINGNLDLLNIWKNCWFEMVNPVYCTYVRMIYGNRNSSWSALLWLETWICLHCLHTLNHLPQCTP